MRNRGEVFGTTLDAVSAWYPDPATGEPVFLEEQACGNVPPELGEQMRHFPSAPAASTEAGVGADEASEAVQLGLEHPAAAVGDLPVRASMGWGSRSTTRRRA